MTDIVDLSGCDVRPRAQEGVEVPLRDPAGRATRVMLRVRGTDSQAYHDALKDQTRRQIERAPRKSSEEERNADFWALQATLVCGWSVEGKPAKLQLEKDGQALECTPANVAAVLEKHQWFFEQVLAVATKRENFLPGSASS